MAIEILMPALSPTMTEGNLVKWSVKEGDKVVAGTVIAEIETDKATMEVEAVDEGIIGKILVPGGTEAVKVNQLIALLLEDGEDAASLNAYESTISAPAVAAAPQTETNDAPPVEVTQALASGDRVFATPLARRLADQKGLDLHVIQGSGPRGRVLRDDVLTAQPGSKKTASAVASSGPAGYETVALSSMRKVIAKRLQESKQQVPHFYLTVDCCIDALLDLRKEINGAQDQKISVNDLVIKAAALALRDVPEANASWNGDSVKIFNAADISVAVAIDGGLITPIVFGAERRSVVDISATMKDLAARARDGKLKPEEFQGGTFSISNLGMYGIKEFKAIINPPQGCILAVGAGEQRAVVQNGALAVATVMTCTLSVDHRVVDGAVGAQYMQALKKYIETPLLLLI